MLDEGGTTLNFGTPDKVWDTINASEDVCQVRAQNRIRIDQSANGFPPLDEQQAQAQGIKVNFNSQEMALLLANARRQYTNSVLQPGTFFKITIPLAPEEKKDEWGAWCTDFINRMMKKSKPYFHFNQNRFCSLVSHGIAPAIWYDKESWRSKYVSIGDLRVPTDTETSLENLEWFAVRKYYTPGELIRKVWSEHSDKGWNKPAIAHILDAYKDINWDTEAATWMTNPEKMAELQKQNMGYLTSDAVPSIALWHFYYADNDEPSKKGWKLVVLPEADTVRSTPQDEFLYERNRVCAQEVSEVLHIQFGDLSSVAPHMYHSVRSLGFLLMEPCFWSNLALCRSIQHLFENFNVWLRNTDPTNRGRVQKVEMFDQSWLPTGVSIVPQNERHQIDTNFLESVSARLKQLQSEASASYTQQVDNGTAKEQTAFETQVKMSMVNAMMSGLLGVFFFQETFHYQEICRRLCISKSQDRDAQRFQEGAKAFGIPRVWLNANLWDIEPTMPIGSGNPAMAASQVTQLMNNREKYGPAAQEEILHDFTAVTTGDFRKAARLVPLGASKKATPAQKVAEADFGILMRGLPANIMDGINSIEQIETMLGLYAGQTAMLVKSGDATMRDVQGLSMVQQHIAQLIAGLAQNKAEKQRAKQYSDSLGKITNEVRGIAQRIQEAQKKQQQQAGQGGAAAEAAPKIIQAQVSAKIKEQKNTQQMAHKQQVFKADQRRKDAETFAEIQRKNILAENSR